MATNKKKIKAHAPTVMPRVIRKQVSQTRADIADWKRARALVTAVNNPKQHPLQDIYAEIAIDSLLSSQLSNRLEKTISADFEMVTPDGKRDEKLTDMLRDIPIMVDLMGFIVESEWYGYSLVELSTGTGTQRASLIPRRNVVPDFGRFYPDTSMDNYIEYRDMDEYGNWILEFNSDHIGRLNKAVPHVMFKRFAQSCWSELCEIYGIPPRVMKTETRDPQMLDRAEAMMREVGAAAWFIIDKTEEFNFAQGVNTAGDVYNNLITLCNNEMSMLVSGAVIGQDTKNGNESKEKVSVEMLDHLVDADKRMVEMYMNSVVIPAFHNIGWIPATSSKFRFETIENTDRLWDLVRDILPYKDVDNDFITEKFGIPVSDKPGFPPVQQR